MKGGQHGVHKPFNEKHDHNPYAESGPGECGTRVELVDTRCRTRPKMCFGRIIVRHPLYFNSPAHRPEPSRSCRLEEWFFIRSLGKSGQETLRSPLALDFGAPTPSNLLRPPSPPTPYPPPLLPLTPSTPPTPYLTVPTTRSPSPPPHLAPAAFWGHQDWLAKSVKLAPELLDAALTFMAIHALGPSDGARSQNPNCAPSEHPNLHRRKWGGAPVPKWAWPHGSESEKYTWKMERRLSSPWLR